MELEAYKNKKKKDDLKAIFKGLREEQNNIGIDTAICIYKRSDGVVGVYTTYANSDEIIGLLELGKMDIIEEIYDKSN